METLAMSWIHEHTWKLPVPPARIFAALTEPDQLARWFAERVDLSLEAGGRFRFWGKHTLGTPTPAEANQSVIRIEPNQVLEFSWAIGGVPTVVRLAVAAEEEGSRLTLHHTVTGDLGGRSRQRELIEDHWLLAIGNLAAHLAGGSGIVLPDYADPEPKVTLSILIAAPKEAVFRALIEPDAINQWFGSKSAVVEPRVGGRYHLNWQYQVGGRDVVGGPTRILELVPNEKLVLDWPDWRGDQSVTGQWIAFQLVAEGSSTRVNFVHGGFGRPSDQGDYPFGWVYFLGELVKVAEKTATG